LACSDRNKGNNLTTERGNKNMETKTTRTELQEPTDASLVCSTSAELLNATSLENIENISDNSMLCSHSGSEYNLNEGLASMSGRIFVLSFTGKPLTPCKPGKARKLICGGVAKVVWNKFGEFGIQMLIPTRRACRFDNRKRDGFIAPSQLMMVQSRLKAIQELFNY